jgi:hypothetical protein
MSRGIANTGNKGNDHNSSNTSIIGTPTSGVTNNNYMMNNRRLGLLSHHIQPDTTVILRDEEKFDTQPSTELLAWADRANQQWADRRKQRWHKQRSMKGLPYMVGKSSERSTW